LSYSDGRVTATVTNTGDRPGAEVVQLYATTPDSPASAQRPRKRLIGFRKVSLQPRRSTQVTIPVRPEDLAFFDEKTATFRLDPGRTGLQLSSSSANKDIKQQTYVSMGPMPAPQPYVVTAEPGRLRFPSGSRIDPQPTVAYTDQSLRHTGVTYTSNRPSVVAVEGDHLVARNPGVATITAISGPAQGAFVIEVVERS